MVAETPADNAFRNRLREMKRLRRRGGDPDPAAPQPARKTRQQKPPKPAGLSARSQTVLAAIIAHKLAHDGTVPSLEYLGNHIKMEKSSVYWQLNKLETTGKIRRVDGATCVVGGRWLFDGEASDPVLAAIVEYKRQHDGNAPSIDKLMVLCGMARNMVWRRLRSLEDAGLIRYARLATGYRGPIEVVGGRWEHDEGEEGRP